jgi:hypothetical protein
VSDHEAPAGSGPPRAPRPQPTGLELLRWSAILLGLSLLVAAIAIPLLRWLGLNG